MPKVLIIGPMVGYNKSVADAFVQLNWEVEVETYNIPLHPFKGWLRWKHKLSFNRERLKAKNREKYNRFIISRFEEINPDLVFIFNGDILLTETLDTFRQSATVALWMFDTLHRYPRSQGHINHVDGFFCYDMKDVEWCEKQGRTAFFMPQACDETSYFPISTDKDIDILFIGTLYRYPKRIKLLRLIINKFSDKKVLIFGVYKPYYKNIIRWAFREKRKVFKNKAVPTDEVNRYYNRAKLVLNIHHESQQYGANPKVFEIAAAGAYQICDTNPFIKSLFTNGEIGLYQNEDELIALIEDALQNSKDENAKQAREVVLSGHTFLHRVKEILNILSKQPLANIPPKNN